jgi:hypothetical protein
MSKADKLDEVAHHEAGHAVACVRYGGSLGKVEVLHPKSGVAWCRLPRISPKRVGATRALPTPERRRRLAPMIRETARRRIIVLLAGPAAQLKFADSDSDTHDAIRSDIYRAHAMAEQSKRLGLVRDDEGEFLRCWEKAQEFVSKNWNVIAAVAAALKARRRLTGREVRAVMRDRPGRPR